MLKSLMKSVRMGVRKRLSPRSPAPTSTVFQVNDIGNRLDGCVSSASLIYLPSGRETPFVGRSVKSFDDLVTRVNESTGASFIGIKHPDIKRKNDMDVLFSYGCHKYLSNSIVLEPDLGLGWLLRIVSLGSASRYTSRVSPKKFSEETVKSFRKYIHELHEGVPEGFTRQDFRDLGTALQGKLC